MSVSEFLCKRNARGQFKVIDLLSCSRLSITLQIVGETLGYKTLRREMITLIIFFFAEDLEDAGVAFQARGVQLDSIQQMGNPAEPAVGIFYRDAADYAMHVVPFSQQMLSQITTVLAGNASNKRAFSAHCFLPVC